MYCVSYDQSPGAPGIFIAYYIREGTSVKDWMSNISGALRCRYHNWEHRQQFCCFPLALLPWCLPHDFSSVAFSFSRLMQQGEGGSFHPPPPFPGWPLPPHRAQGLPRGLPGGCGAPCPDNLQRGGWQGQRGADPSRAAAAGKRGWNSETSAWKIKPGLYYAFKSARIPCGFLIWCNSFL